MASLSSSAVWRSAYFPSNRGVHGVRSGLLLWTALLLACAHDSPIDELCIKGQLSAEQAASLDPHAYATLPSYCQEATPPGQHGGDAHCQAEALDRILAAHCSGALK